MPQREEGFMGVSKAFVKLPRKSGILVFCPKWLLPAIPQMLVAGGLALWNYFCLLLVSFFPFSWLFLDLSYLLAKPTLIGSCWRCAGCLPSGLFSECCIFLLNLLCFWGFLLMNLRSLSVLEDSWAVISIQSPVYLVLCSLFSPKLRCPSQSV